VKQKLPITQQTTIPHTPQLLLITAHNVAQSQ